MSAGGREVLEEITHYGGVVEERAVGAVVVRPLLPLLRCLLLFFGGSLGCVLLLVAHTSSLRSSSS